MEGKAYLLSFLKFLGPTLIGFVLGIVAARIGLESQTDQRSMSIARVLASEVSQELKTTVAVIDGIVANIKADRLVLAPLKATSVYSPNTETTRFNDIGLLDAKIVDAYVSFNQIVRASADTRRAYISALAASDSIAPGLYFAYLLGLNEMVQRGKKLLTSISESYHSEEPRKVPEYAQPLNIEELKKHLPRNMKMRITNPE